MENVTTSKISTAELNGSFIKMIDGGQGRK